MIGFELDRRTLLKNSAVAAGAGSVALRADKVLASEASPARMRLLLDRGWRFHLGHAADTALDFGFGKDQRTYAKAGTVTAAQSGFDESGWTEIRVPHDWAYSLPFAPPRSPPPEDQRDAAAAHGFRAIGRAFPENSVGWYRRKLELPKNRPAGRVWLEFDGVFRDTLVMVNGYIVAEETSGYAPFVVDVTDFLNTDGSPDQLALRVEVSLGEGWFYEGAGIYRDVHLVVASQVHIAPWSVQAIATPGGGAANLKVCASVSNTGTGPAKVELRQSVRDAEGRTVALLPPCTAAIEPGAEARLETTGAIAAPRLWSPTTPALYVLVSELHGPDGLLDSVATRFGVRDVRFDPERGMLLNGVPVKLLGVCNHHDHAGTGTAIPPALERWRIARMQEMGANAWRVAHNPPSSTFLDACDEMGMMVIDELRLNTTSEQGIDELDRIVRRDRNHPSVILWSIGNEEPQQGTERGKLISQHLADAVRRRDPTRAITQAFDNSFDKGAVEAVDVVGFNYRTSQIPDWHRRFPDRPVIGTETGSTVSTRGAYFNDNAAHVLRAYDTEHPWWATTAEEWWTIVADAPYIAGGFIWTGFDYHGEPTPFPEWPSVSSYFGAADICGFPKDNFWYYRAWWRREEPLIHLFPHWNWAGREGQPVEVWVHSNCDAVELFANGVSQGRKAVVLNRHLAWQVPYEPGEISAKGWRGGRLVANARRRTTGAPAALALGVDRKRLLADGRDAAVLTVSARDAKGLEVPTANLPFSVSLDGPGRLIATGNGDPLAKGTGPQPTALFNGLAQLIVQSEAGPGTVTVRVDAPGLKPATTALFVLA
ncbi:beta-galactosidase [Novosphingobium sp. CF614]|uniref:beta-galactosidase GalA n=1 Tax=Novosphingobium sp. CF614 TaxID=1884364 RepID=UPI0008E515A9|nr:beta-galactosidase GalA [Novosphingobium sp. CF614]SFF85475.1 beta-galactosidase [Novosphingobium sp. CF614]